MAINLIIQTSLNGPISDLHGIGMGPAIVLSSASLRRWSLEGLR
jgi:hypothetical protein